MLMVLSPAKNLQEGPAIDSLPTSEPALLDDTAALLKVARRWSVANLKARMSLSDALATLNHERFQTFLERPGPTEARQAARLFNGDVYQGLHAETLTKADLEFGQQHLAILSGLYGVLRPLDLVQPYRLEMGTKVKTRRGEDLYAFWGDRIAAVLAERVADHDDKTLINLASKEYFSAVALRALPGPVLTPVFRDVKNGKSRVISFFAKKARGAMARFALQQRLTRPEGLKGFNDGGYTFQPDLSTKAEWVFTRPQPPPVNG
ncbi:MAG: peroxide stress protein YaaA [Myxococcota bacterium]